MSASEQLSQSRSWNRRGPILVITAFLGLAISQFLSSRTIPHHGDLVTYRNAAGALFAKPLSSIYAAEPNYVYPPFPAICLYALDALSQPLASFLWDVCRYASFGGSLLICYRLMTPRCGSSTACVLILVCILANIRPMWHDTVHGNVNAFLLLGIVLGWRSMARRASAAAGLFWSLVGAIKPGSAAVLLAPIAQGRRPLLRCWIVAFCVIVATNLVLPIMTLGYQATGVQWKDYARGVRTTPVFEKHGNHSLGTGLTRIGARLLGEREKDAFHEHVRAAWGLSSLVIVGWVLALLVRLYRKAPSDCSDYAVSLCCLMSVLVSPAVWYSHYLLLTPVYLSLMRRCLTGGRRWMRIQSGASVLFATTLINGQATILGTLAWAPLVLLISLTLLILYGLHPPAHPRHAMR